jgi:hypothetical protein
MKCRNKEQPIKTKFGSDAALSDCDGSPFYIFKECLYNQEIWNYGAEVSVQPLRVFDGSENYLKESDDPTGYFSDGYCRSLISSDEPSAFLITLNFLKKCPVHLNVRHFEDDRLWF